MVRVENSRNKGKINKYIYDELLKLNITRRI